jgi:hypothetical protein
MVKNIEGIDVPYIMLSHGKNSCGRICQWDQLVGCYGRDKGVFRVNSSREKGAGATVLSLQ